MKNETISRVLLYVALIVVAVVVVWGFTLIGSPSFNRKLSGDRSRIDDLRRLTHDIQQYFQEQKNLPVRLNDLEKLTYSYSERHLEDLTTKKPYDYRVISSYEYELCADFELTSKEAELERSKYESINDKTWEHGVGHYCFKFEIKSMS